MHPARDKLTFSVKAHDIHRNPINRSTLGLSLELSGRTTHARSTAPLKQLGGSNVFGIEIPELWTQEPEIVDMTILVAGKNATTVTLTMTENNSRAISMGVVAAVVAIGLLAGSVFLLVKYASIPKPMSCRISTARSLVGVLA
jgi:hypothetical protein